MSTVKASWSQIPASGQVIEVCQDLPGGRLATSSVDGSNSYIQIWEKDSSTGDWDMISQITVHHPVLHLAWPHPENGLLLAGGTGAGSVVFWEAPRPGGASRPTQALGEENQVMEDQREWKQAAEVQCSKHAIRQICFAPRQLGLVLAAASKDGGVHVIEADRPLAPNAWTIQSRFVAGQGPTSDVSTPPECCGVSWRAFSPGVAPLMAVGVKGGVEVWQYIQTVMSWQRVASLHCSVAGAQTAHVHWAPTLGRPCDLIAAAHGSTVDVFSVTGDSSALQVELLTSLEHGAAVHKAEFNLMGTCLATSTEGNLVHLWKPDFVGRWLLVSAIQGSPDAAEERD